LRSLIVGVNATVSLFLGACLNMMFLPASLYTLTGLIAYTWIGISIVLVTGSYRSHAKRQCGLKCIGVISIGAAPTLLMANFGGLALFQAIPMSVTVALLVSGLSLRAIYNIVGAVAGSVLGWAFMIPLTLYLGVPSDPIMQKLLFAIAHGGIIYFTFTVGLLITASFASKSFRPGQE